MPNPQDPNLARNRKSSATPEAATPGNASTSAPEPADHGVAPIPEANQPGHHPEHESDKPTAPPPP